jgi:dTDP-4-dehydrorhamnose 3,5-epimerase
MSIIFNVLYWHENDENNKYIIRMFGKTENGKSVSVILTAHDPKLIYVPRGFYHGFVTLEPNTLVSYKVDQYHSAEKECGIAWDDPILNLNWAIRENLTISNRDQNNPSWDLAYKF